jgi:hypothetical protein
MPKFLVTYHGMGEPAPEQAQQAMAAFMACASSVGDALVDPGAPLGPARTVSSGSVSDGPADGPAGGYSSWRPPTWIAPWRWSRPIPLLAAVDRCRSAQRLCPTESGRFRASCPGRPAGGRAVP